MYIVTLLISFFACVIGAICGIGGGVIIKPVLDAFGRLSVASISFLSGCTVLSMSLYSVGKSLLKKESMLDFRVSTPLAIGAALGGILGKYLFELASSMFQNLDSVGAVQAIVLFGVTFGTLIYSINKDKVHTLHTKNWAVCLSIGLVLGIMSSFLGIGGGPINLVALYYFFSMPTKTAAQNSLYIILFSQFTSLVCTLITRTTPEFELNLFLGMVLCGILGGIAGRKINLHLSERLVNRLFLLLMLVIMLINVFNAYKFLV